MFITFLTFLLSFSTLFSWAHLELGAGNYGQRGQRTAAHLEDGNTASEIENYIHQLDNQTDEKSLPHHQYAVLFWTLDELILRYGEEGIFHLNDINEEYARYAAKRLQVYAEKQGYEHITVEAITGDYSKIEFPLKYDSVHLKNPESTLLYDEHYRKNPPLTPQTRQKKRELLQKLANLSTNGLYFFILDDPLFIPPQEREEYMEKEIFYKQIDEWPSVPYFTASGKLYKAEGIVFFIERELP